MIIDHRYQYFVLTFINNNLGTATYLHIESSIFRFIHSIFWIKVIIILRYSWVFMWLCFFSSWNCSFFARFVPHVLRENECSIIICFCFKWFFDSKWMQFTIHSIQYYFWLSFAMYGKLVELLLCAKLIIEPDRLPSSSG